MLLKGHCYPAGNFHAFNGRGRLLFTWIVLLGAAVAALFANDGAALILTPIVIAMLLALGFSQGTTLAFVMAAGFIADTASLPLIVSNLVNIVSADFFDLGFTQYASVMIPVDAAAIAATLIMLHLFFRRDIPATYDVSLLKTPASVIKDAATFRAGWIVLLLLLVGFFVLEPLGIPVSAIAAAGAAVLFIVAKRGHGINTESPAQCAMADRDFFAGHVPGGLWPAQCRAHGVSVWCTEPAGRKGVMGSNVRHRLPDRVPVVGDEQYADGADWRAVD
jgi:Na+/H+ antiporter NhaD/arsenite permease-like protein